MDEIRACTIILISIFAMATLLSDFAIRKYIIDKNSIFRKRSLHHLIHTLPLTPFNTIFVVIVLNAFSGVVYMFHASLFF